jgi:hypothetical protein
LRPSPSRRIRKLRLERAQHALGSAHRYGKALNDIIERYTRVAGRTKVASASSCSAFQKDTAIASHDGGPRLHKRYHEPLPSAVLQSMTTAVPPGQIRKLHAQYRC